MGANRAVAGAVAFGFADAGADVALTTATSQAEEAHTITRLARSITSMGRQVLAEAVDLSVGANVQLVLRQLSNALGGIDVVVVAAEIRQRAPTDRLADDEWSRLVNANLSATVLACRWTGQEMATRDPDSGFGRLILLLPNVETTAPAGYVATRIAVASLVPALAREWAALPLTVHGINLPAGLDDEAAGAETAYVALRLAGYEGDEKNGRVLRTGSFR
jgi:NAD(P)-dependent dehydrogenase (short-subunit alcohol dehydrogenase family)